MPHVEGAGVLLHYTERGAGPTVLVVHAEASDAAAVAPPAEQLAGAGARVITYDRRGYGVSGAPEPYTATTVQEQGEDAAALLDGLGAAPALMVGEGFGALVVLDLLVRRPSLARAAVLVEPPLFAFVPQAMEVLAAERATLEEALRDGGPERAVAGWLGAGADPARVARAQAAQRGFFADYAGRASWSPARGELRAIAVAVAVVTGPSAAPHVAAAADAVAALLADGRRAGDGETWEAARALM